MPHVHVQILCTVTIVLLIFGIIWITIIIYNVSMEVIPPINPWSATSLIKHILQ